MPQLLVCLHDARETASDRARREHALDLARAINVAQGQTLERTRQYAALDQLKALPPPPSGFKLRLYTAGEGYVLSIKDELDPCHYGVFSDELGRLYAMSPQVPQVAGR